MHKGDSMRFTKSYKFKFIAFISFFIILISVITTMVAINNIKSTAFSVFSSQGESLVKRALYKIDADRFSELAETLDESHPYYNCLLYTSPSPRDFRRSRMPSSA